jgi:hypothetical protein
MDTRIAEPDETARPKVRDILSGDLEGVVASGGMTEKEVAELLAPIGGGLSGNLFHVAMKVGEATGRSLNLASRKSVDHLFAAPYPHVVRSLGLALASLRHQPSLLFDTRTGCVIETQMPTDIFSLGGSLQFEIVDEGAQARVLGSSEVRGQLFDWGKGKRNLNEVIRKTEDYLRIIRR